MSIEAFTPADLAALLDGEPAGEAEEALAGLLGDEWEEVYPPAAQVELRARLDAAGWPEPFARCPRCQTVFLRRFRPDSGRCRECAARLVPRPRQIIPTEESLAPTPTRTWGEAPAEVAPRWALAEGRLPREVPSEEGLDFLELRAQELLEVAARTEAADWLGGGEHDPSDEVPALPLQAPEPDQKSAPLEQAARADRSERAADPDAGSESRLRTAQAREDAATHQVPEELAAGPAAGSTDEPADAISANQLATDSIVGDEVPAYGLSTDEIVADEHPADEHPADGHPADEHPADEHPADGHPADRLDAALGPPTGEDPPAPEATALPEPDRGLLTTPAIAPAERAASSSPPAARPALQGAAPAELREETGRRAGRTHTLALGSSYQIGTARRGQVVLRQRGVAFKHAELRVAEDGSATITDLGTGQTWLGEELLSANEVRPLSSGDVVRCGEAILAVTLTQAQAPVQTPVQTPAPAAPSGPEAAWQPPSAAELAAARHTPPSQILAALPASQLDLVARAARAVPLPRWRAAQPRAERAFVDHDAQAFAQLVRGVLDGRYLPEDAATWLRWEEDEESFLCRSALEDGATVILAPWDLLARLPEPLPGSGPARVGRFLELLLPRNTGRLVAEEEGELAGGFWRCRYASRDGLCAGRFSSIEARSNGHVLTATLTPRFPLQAAAPSFAEDPHQIAMGDLRDRPAWRPPPRGHGAPAPHVPRGGRHRERRRARDHYR